MVERDTQAPFAIIAIAESRLRRTLLTYRNNPELRRMDVVFDGIYKVAGLLEDSHSTVLSCDLRDGRIVLLGNGDVIDLESSHAFNRQSLRAVINHFTVDTKTRQDSDLIVGALISGENVTLGVIRGEVSAVEFTA